MTTLAAQVTPLEKAQKDLGWYLLLAALGWIAATATGAFLGVYLAHRLRGRADARAQSKTALA
jgi:uncharacterized membrane protein YfcA